MSVSSCVLRHSSVDTGSRTLGTPRHIMSGIYDQRDTTEFTSELIIYVFPIDAWSGRKQRAQYSCASSVPGPRYLRGRDDDNLGPTFLSTWVSPAAELSRAEIDGGWRVGIAALGSGWQCTAVCGCGHHSG